MKRGFFCAILLWCFFTGVNAGASTVSVGDQSVVIADSLARIEDWFGRPAVSIFFFSAPLSDEQKSALAAKRYAKDKDYETLGSGHYPVLNLLLFFDKGTDLCSSDKLVSYTAVFQQNPSFAFGSAEKGPINWAITRSPSQSLLSLGITRLSCSFNVGDEVDVQVAYEWLAQGEPWSGLYPPGTGNLPFRWDIDVKTKIVGDLR